MNIKVGSLIYEIVEAEELYLNNNECMGIISYEDLIIKIKKNLKDQRKTQTLWHELVHAIIDEYIIDFKEMDEERIVDLISKGIVCILLENKNFDGTYKTEEAK